MTGPHVDQAVAALTGRVPRLRASAASQPQDAARERELADGLCRLASLVAHGPSEVRRLLDPSMGQGISADVRKHAGNEIYALASQRDSKGTEHNALAGVRAGRGRGGDDLGLPIHRATLQEAVALLELAKAIHPEPFWIWTQPALLLRLGHYMAAAKACESAGGGYARHASTMVAQCEAKAAGTHDPVIEHARRLEPQIPQCEVNGVDPAPLIEIQARVGKLIARAAQQSQLAGWSVLRRRRETV